LIGRVFQVDDSRSLTPYQYETRTLGRAEIAFTEGFCDDADDVIERAAAADVLWLAWKPRIDRAILKELPRCRLVVRWGIGYDQIDVDAATDLGVAVANAPTYGTEDVAEHALALLFALGRRLLFFDADVRGGGWTTPEPRTIRRIQGRTLGLLGFGRIGEAFTRRAKGVGLSVIGYDAYQPAAVFKTAGVESVTLNELAQRSDYVSVHVPHTLETEGIVDAAFLNEMKSSAYLINTSRGRVVNETALVQALSDGTIAGAGLDVFWNEPLPHDSPLRHLPNVVLTPHYAGYSEDSWAALREEMCQTTIDFLTTGWAGSIINVAVRGQMRPDNNRPGRH
jgi:D-3-phosphoglycerate dehydrogenase